MPRMPLALLIACLLTVGLVGPARAEDPPDPRPAPQVPEAPPDETTASAIVLPLPFLAVYGVAAIQNIKLGPTRHDVSARGGYVWTVNTVYDPKSTAPRPLLGEAEFWQPANFWNFYAAWGWRLAPTWTLYLDGYAAGGGLAKTPGYDQALTQGASASWGPMLGHSTLDEVGFPTRGALTQVGWAPGRHWGTESLDFQRASVEHQHFWPLGGDRTLAVRGLAMAGWPRLAWVDKFYAGGAMFLRGYQWSRFTGDRLLSGTVEYRHLFATDLLAPLGWGGTGLGLAWETYVDAGRAWETAGAGVPFLSDLRYGAGTGLILTIQRAPIGRLELNVSAEGFYPVAGVGASF